MPSRPVVIELLNLIETKLLNLHEREGGKEPFTGRTMAEEEQHKATRQRRSVSPSLLSETQTVALPVGIALAALIAKGVYFDLVFRLPSPASFYFAAGGLTAIAMYLVASQTSLHSVSAIVNGESQSLVLVATVSFSFLLTLCIFFLLKVSDQFSRGWFALWYALSVFFLLLERFSILIWAQRLRAQNRLFQRVAVYGSVDLAERLLDKLFASSRNLNLAGVFSDDNPSRACRKPVLGGMSQLIKYAQSGACDRVILAMPLNANENIRDAVRSLEVLPIDVQLSPDAMTLPCQIHGSQGSDGLLLLDLQKPPLSERAIIVKTVMDYLIGSIVLAAFAPLVLLIAIAIKLESPGPVIFVQARNGYNQRLIRVFKFRTMTVCEDGPVVIQAVRGDKRVTRVGRILRRTSLDELPQLINVMQGELSLVGPRPHAVTHNQAYERILTSYATRHKVKPGITGWAQVHGLRGETKTPEVMRKRVEFDLYYINHWSPWLDFQILAKTALVPFTRSGAY